MGYRSEVGLVLNKKAVDRLRRAFNTYKRLTVLRAVIDKDAKLSELSDIFKEADVYKVDNETKSELYVWSWIKWWDEYITKDVEIVSRFLELMESDDFLFIRLGEDTEDIEILGTYYDNPFGFNYVRKIVFNGDDEE